MPPAVTLPSARCAWYDAPVPFHDTEPITVPLQWLSKRTRNLVMTNVIGSCTYSSTRKRPRSVSHPSKRMPGAPGRKRKPTALSYQSPPASTWSVEPSAAEMTKFESGSVRPSRIVNGTTTQSRSVRVAPEFLAFVGCPMPSFAFDVEKAPLPSIENSPLPTSTALAGGAPMPTASTGAASAATRSAFAPRLIPLMLPCLFLRTCPLRAAGSGRGTVWPVRVSARSPTWRSRVEWCVDCYWSRKFSK